MELNLKDVKEIFIGKKTILILIGIILAEIFSFISFFNGGSIKTFIFLLILIGFLALCVYSLKWGLYLVFIELFIGSLGSMFYIEESGFEISLRMGFWLIFLAVWFLTAVKKKKIPEFFKSKDLALYLPLFIFIAWGLVNGYLNNHEINTIFSDFNGWLYFALILPVYDLILRKTVPFKEFLQIFIASTLSLVLKTLLLLFIFSHNLLSLITPLYEWTRDTELGEITQMPDTFTRIFFQSHIFVVIAFFLSLFLFNRILLEGKKDKKYAFLISLLVIISLFAGVVLLSFSRSFWVGTFAGSLSFLILILWIYGWKRLFANTAVIASAFLLGILIITAIVKLPLVGPGVKFSTTGTMKNRAKTVSNEAAVSSRWSLLPELWKDIKEGPVRGKGFGATITYKSSDPRVLEKNPSGKYTTFAFEWGWLDIWLKLGFFGLLFYLVLQAKTIFNPIFTRKIKDSAVISSFVVGLIVVGVINFFTPYLNHPLGIGYLIITTALVDRYG